MQLDRGEVRDPDQRRQVLDHAIVDLAVVAVAPHGRGVNPLGAMAWALLFVEVLALDTVWVALER